METWFISGSTKLSKYVNFSLSENINRIEAYLASKHISGEEDEQGREKPFFNIVRGARNIWIRATDLDRKNVKVKAQNARNIVLAFVMNALLKKWMRESNFGQFLNDWGTILASYGSAVVEFVEKKNELVMSVLQWNRLIIDSIDFEQNPCIKILELTEAELRANPLYDQMAVETFIGAYNARQTNTRETQDINPGYVRLYETHGVFPLWHITGVESDKKIFTQQMQVIGYVGKKNNDKEFDDFVVYAGNEKNPHMMTTLIPEVGRSMGIGAVENLFESQWMTNHSVKAMKDQLDLAGKLIFQTADSNFASQNILTAIDNGDILIHKVNMPLTTVTNNAHDVTTLQAFANMWRALGQEIDSTPSTLLGGAAPAAGMSWRLASLLQTQALSNFEYMRQNKALAVEQMLRRFILPFLKKQMNNSKEIAAVLDGEDISQFDSAYIASEASTRLKKKVIASLVKGEVPQGLSMEGEQAGVQAELSAMGDHRFIKPSDISDVTWKMMLKDFECEVICDIGSEDEDSQLILQTLNMTLQTIVSNPAILNDPNAKMVFNKILETTGVMSPLSLRNAPPPVPPAPAAPVASPIQPQQVRKPASVSGGGTAVGGGA